MGSFQHKWVTLKPRGLGEDSVRVVLGKLDMLQLYSSMKFRVKRGTGAELGRRWLVQDSPHAFGFCCCYNKWPRI